MTRRICWTDENFSWYSARIDRSTSASMSSSSAISLIAPVSSAEIVPLAAITAKQARTMATRWRIVGELLELARHDVVLGATDGLRLELGHLGHEDRGRLVDRLAGLELALDGCRLLVADVEVGVGGPGEGVRGRGDEAGLLGRHRLELGDDPPDRRGIAGRVRDGRGRALHDGRLGSAWA